MISSVSAAVENEAKKGAKTIVAVGGNRLFHNTLNAVARLKDKQVINQVLPIGFIPIDKKYNSIAENLGLSYDQEACDILSARRIEELDLGQVNQNFFLTEATIPTLGTTLEIDEDYFIDITTTGEIAIVNLPSRLNLPPEAKSSPKDGLLELFIQTKTSGKLLPLSKSASINDSVFSFNRLRVINEQSNLLLDDAVEASLPAIITPSAKKIQLIVGRNRNFT
jgi:uncharacterized protein YuzE